MMIPAKSFVGDSNDAHQARRRTWGPLPWSVEESDACFIVKDGAGQKLAYVCVSRRSRDGARRPSCSPATRQADRRQALTGTTAQHKCAASQS
jgi:hypothetical protein